MPGYRAAERATGSGDQDGPVGAPGDIARGRRARPGHPGREYRSPAQGDLRLTGRHRGGQHRQGRPVAVVGRQVHENDAVRVFGLRRAHQSGHRGARQVARLLPAPAGDGSPGDDGEPALGEPLVGQPGLEDAEDAVHLAVRRLRGAVRAAGGHEDHSVVRHPGEAVGRDGTELPRQCRVSVAQDVPAPGVLGRFGGGLPPLDPEQRVGRPGYGLGPHGRRRQRTQQQRADREHGLPRGVGHVDGDGTAAHRTYPHPHGRRGDGVQVDALPGERQHRLVGGGGAEPDGVQHGVEQRRVDPEPVGVGLLRVRQAHLGEGLAVPLPDGAQPLEGGPVGHALAGEVRVQAVERHLFGAGRRPGREIEGGPRGARCQRSGGVAGPRRVTVRVLGACVHGEPPDAGSVGRRHGQLDAYACLPGHHERCLDGQFLQAGASGPVARLDRHLHETGAREQRGSADHVVGEPRMRAQGDASREQQSLGVGEFRRRPEQRMLLGTGAGGRLHPVPLPLEGVGGQLDEGPAAEDGPPVDGPTAVVQGSQRREHRRGLRLALPQQRGRHGVLDTVVQRLPDECGECAAGAQLHEPGHAQRFHGEHRVVEADGAAHLTYPVVRGAQLLAGAFARDRGHHRDTRLRVGQLPCDGGELLEHRLHERRVEGV
ncbi:hypothetical protein SBADM41S_05639 [Streptomyces badius]